jgi:hypothetical protein
MFLKGLLLMVAMSPCQTGGSMNDNSPQRHVRFIDEPSRETGGTISHHTKRVGDELTGHVVAAIALVAGILALPLLQDLVVPATTARDWRSEVIRGDPMKPAMLEPQKNKWGDSEVAPHLSGHLPC